MQASYALELSILFGVRAEFSEVPMEFRNTIPTTFNGFYAPVIL